MRAVGLGDDVPAPIAKAIHEECFPRAELAIYDRTVRVILVGDDWRKVGGLTRLIHEMQHYADDLAGLPGEDECGATRVASAWADAHNYYNEARRERRYGAASCVGGGGRTIADIISVPRSELADAASNGVLGPFRTTIGTFLAPND